MLVCEFLVLILRPLPSLLSVLGAGSPWVQKFWRGPPPPSQASREANPPSLPLTSNKTGVKEAKGRGEREGPRRLGRRLYRTFRTWEEWRGIAGFR